MHVERAERARIDEDQASTVGEVEHGAREARQRRTDRSTVPIAIHAEMHVNDAAVIEVEELVLSPPLDARDLRTDEGAQHPGETRRRRAGCTSRSLAITRSFARRRSSSTAACTSGSSGMHLHSAVDSVHATPPNCADARDNSIRDVVRRPGRALDRRAPRLDVRAAPERSVAALKITVGARTGALTVLGAALESTLDMLSNGVAILAISVAARAPDEDHPYGHEKFETLGTLAIVGFLSITCFELVRRSIEELASPTMAPTADVVDAVILLLSLGVNGFVVSYERSRGRRFNSSLLLADASHTASDILVTALAMASLLLSHLGFVAADALLGIVVALIIAWSGYQILRDSIPVLVDERGVEATRLQAIARSIPGVEGVRSVRSRRTSSGHLFVELTILVSGGTSVENAHELTDDVERAIAQELGGAEAIVHVEPSGSAE